MLTFKAYYKPAHPNPHTEVRLHQLSCASIDVTSGEMTLDQVNPFLFYLVWQELFF